MGTAGSLFLGLFLDINCSPRLIDCLQSGDDPDRWIADVLISNGTAHGSSASAELPDASRRGRVDVASAGPITWSDRRGSSSTQPPAPRMYSADCLSPLWAASRLNCALATRRNVLRTDLLRFWRIDFMCAGAAGCQSCGSRCFWLVSLPTPAADGFAQSIHSD